MSRQNEGTDVVGASREEAEREALVMILDRYATAVYTAARDDDDPPNVDAYVDEILRSLVQQEEVSRG